MDKMATHIETQTVRAVYDTIDPLGNLRESAKGKTILVTGAGRGTLLVQVYFQFNSVADLSIYVM